MINQKKKQYIIVILEIKKYKIWIKYTFVKYKTKIMENNEIERYNSFIDNEFVITEKKQILSSYIVTLKRFEYLIQNKIIQIIRIN